ncbi:phosphoribosylanthranilate isomerase [Paenactinomyces guangxiensis]|uniref:N-(5'-phosphoribosyl)anthranilate isomerase n=1 Tax=Paenactinomyces guangxiensis TaxID=1490290 RepID=A0A7W1WU05_9BACL|nr:phosphoribosylanthranilate isomerase [Paenactinomyces guangxiensis]MBA4496050.1 phosphoribosylanthranilate isomerase [Paenactinomyces guangxiensis]MBH8593138.1 phosphoribosylanthranilate isomerase [Paenactinomyces guangxiensis]
MKRTQIKFCGFRTPGDVEKAGRLRVNAIGFILVPGRKRSVHPRDLPMMVKLVPSQVLSVGVLLNPTIRQIHEWLSLAPLQAVQLHGDESPAFCRSVKEQFQVKIIKTFHVEDRIKSAFPLKEYAPWIDIALLDSSTGTSRGGTGVAFEWERIPPFKEQCSRFQLPCWVAGGLDGENVDTLIRDFAPDGVDVSSGIEKEGQKDPEKMNRFVRKVMLSGQTTEGA